MSQACTLPTPFAEDIAALAEGGCHAIEVWLTKLETHLEHHSVAETRNLLNERQIKLIAASFQGGLLVSQGEKRQVSFDHFRRRLDLCQAFSIPTLVLAADFGERIDQQSLERAVVSLAEAAEWAQAFNVRLALEFHARASFCSSLDTAVMLASACGQPNVGICLDLFHYYTGPSKFDDLALLSPENLFLVQVSDLAGVAREVATDRDRILPGEGDFRLEPILAHLRRIGYDGYVSLEIQNPTLWQVKPAHLVEMGIKSLDRLLHPPGDRTGRTFPGRV
ncbi:MAG: sugar phosphate isomerase/epimerase family protein [Gemmataceae bacterium]